MNILSPAHDMLGFKCICSTIILYSILSSCWWNPNIQAWRNFQQGTLEELFDPNLLLKDDTSSNMKKEIKSVIHIGLLCIQQVPSLRPTMSMALQMLSKNIVPLPSPSNPPCIPQSDTETNEFAQITAFRHRLNNPASLPTVTHTSFSPR